MDSDGRKADSEGSIAMEGAAGAVIHCPPRFPRGSARGEAPALPCTESKRLRSQCRRRRAAPHFSGGGRPRAGGRVGRGEANERGRIGGGRSGDAVAVERSGTRWSDQTVLQLGAS
jgi:hypothetical protein